MLKKTTKKNLISIYLKAMNHLEQLLPTPSEIKRLFPLEKKEALYISKIRKQASDCLERRDLRYVFIVGPCSLHDPKAFIEYSSMWKNLATALENDFLLILRFFPEKSRTLGGWKGFISDPYLDGSHDLKTGLIETRKLLLYLAKNEIPCASEIVDPLLTPYIDDLITWGIMGARSVFSQVHRQHASQYSFPIGWKNSVEGNIEVAIQSAISASQKHVFPSMNQEGKITLFSTLGNSQTHIILRGSAYQSNYHFTSIQKALEKQKDYTFSRHILIDCSHGNSQKDPQKQKICFEEVLTYMPHLPIAGMMLESFLQEGSQDPNKKPLSYGVSITDPCLSFKDTQELLLQAQGVLSKGLSISMSFVQK
jgi:3-deoxy-7-phosphoheptulonate synthase